MSEMTNWLENYAQEIEEQIETPLHMRVGTFKGEYYIGDGEYVQIEGGLFITTHAGNLFTVYDQKQGITATFDILDDNDIINIEEKWFTYAISKDYRISLEQIQSDIETLNDEFKRMSGAWEYNDGGYGCISIAEDELELCKGISSRYPFEYRYNPDEFNKNPHDLSEDWSDIKFDINDFNENNVNRENYDKVDAVAFDFKEELVAMLNQLQRELSWLPPRFRYDFLSDIICQCNQNSHSVRKNCEFFTDTIYNELTEEEINKMFVTL